MPLLLKIAIDEGKTSRVREGQSSHGRRLQLVKHSEEGEVVEDIIIDSIQDIEEGYQLILSSFRTYHRTSEISEIIHSSKDEVIFKTQSSTYKLTP